MIENTGKYLRKQLNDKFLTLKRKSINNINDSLWIVFFENLLGPGAEKYQYLFGWRCKRRDRMDAGNKRYPHKTSH